MYEKKKDEIERIRCESNVLVRCRGGMTSLVMNVLVAYVASGMKC
jgi:hypothetical protein